MLGYDVLRDPTERDVLCVIAGSIFARYGS